MASYALPASVMTHSHHGHSHVQTHSRSHSHGPIRQSSFSGGPSKLLKRELSNGSIHMHTHSGTQYDRTHSNPPEMPHNHEGFVLGPAPCSNGSAHVANQTQKTTYSTSTVDVYEPPKQHVEHAQHDHDPDHKHHEHEHKHGQSHAHKHQSRSIFTSMLLPMVQKYPLLHNILAEKDSRRIFYFMRCVGCANGCFRVLICPVSILHLWSYRRFTASSPTRWDS